MKSITAVSHRLARIATIASAVTALALAAAPRHALAQSQSGFTYNGMDYIDYSQSDYLNSTEAAQTIRAANANFTAVMATWYVQTYDSNAIAPSSSSPSDDAVVAAIQALQAQGITVTLKPHVDSEDGIWRGEFTWPSTDTTTAEQEAWLTAWFTSYQSFILHFAQIATENNVGIMVIGTEFKDLTGNNCPNTSGSSCSVYWQQYVINPMRQQYPNLMLAYGANATGAGDEFTAVTFWNDVDIIGVDGYFPIDDSSDCNTSSPPDPTLAQLVSGWTDNPCSGSFNAVAALKNLSSTYPGKPLVFTEIGYPSATGSNAAPYNYSPTGSYDVAEQENCYQAFFEVFSQQTSWMKGVFWWDWSVSAPGSSDTGYSPQNKPAGDTTLPEWYGSTTQGFTLAASNPAEAMGQGLSTTDIISVTPLDGFTGSVSLSAGGLPTGVTAAFSAGTGTGTQILTLTASSTAATGTATVTITGTSGSLTATTTVTLTVQAAKSQTITFNNPGSQQVGTQLALAATASSGLAVSYSSSTTTVCTVSGSTATLKAAGGCTITAAQAGNGIYSAATPVAQSFQVTTLPPVPVPSDAELMVSQVNWLAALGGYVQTSNNSTGGSFAAGSNGEIAVADTKSLNLINAQTGVLTVLGAWTGSSGAAMDSKNDIYVGSLYGTPVVIVKLPYVGGSTNSGYAAFSTPSTSTPACTGSSTTECTVTAVGAINSEAMEFDAKGDLFWITSSTGLSGGNGIWECTAACLGGTGSPVELYMEPTASPAPSTSSGQLLAGSLSIDSAGNIFFTDSSTYVDLTGDSHNYGYMSFYSSLKELPVSSGAGYGGKTTGYSASPTTLYTVTPASPGYYDNDLDGVAVLRSASNGDTVFFGDLNDGIFGFPDTSTGIPTANGQPTALYMVSTQGTKVMSIDPSGNLYLATGSSVITSGADTVAQLTLNSVSVPGSAVGTPSSPSTTTNPVSTVFNDAGCSSTPAPAANFAANSSTTGSATLSTAGTCASTLTGGAEFAATVSFTPLEAGPDSDTLLGTDQSSNTQTVTVNGAAPGFGLTPSPASVSVAQGSSTTDTVTVSDVGGFSGSVTLSAAGLPSGVTASFAAGTVSGTQVMTLTASSSATAGGPVTVTINGVSGSYTGSTTIQLTVTAPPTFTIGPTTGTLSIAQGATNSSETITVTPANGFSSGVTLSASGLPSGVTASFSPNPTTTDSSVLTLTASSTATVGGPVTVTISGVSGSLTETTTIALTVAAAPTFSLSPTTGTLSITQGATNTSETITVTPANGFASGVTLSASGLPSGVTASFSPNPTTANTSVLTLTASSTATVGGPVTVTITGTSGSLTETTTIALTVAAAPTFSLSPTAGTLSIAQGATNTSETITVTPANGFASGVTLSASGLPTGVTASFSPNPTTANTSVLTLTASSTATIGGPVTITITGTSGSLTKTTTIAVTVTAAPTFSLSPSSGSLSITQGATNTSETITVTPANGFASGVTLSASGQPSGVTASFSPNPTTANTSVLTLTASSTATVGGPVTVTITGTSGTLTETTTIALTVVAPPTFTLTASESAVTLAQANSDSSQIITVVPANGFASAVALTASGLPTGVTASFVAGTAANTQVLTLTATSSATTGGPVTVTITGTSSSLTANTTFNLTVTAEPTFTISPPSGTATMSLEPGATTGNTASFSVTGGNGFSGSVNLTCQVTTNMTGVTDMPTCTMSPTSVTVSGNTASSSTLTVYTTGSSSAANQIKRLLWPSAGGTALALVLLFGVPHRRRNWVVMLGLLVLFVSLGAIGCGGGSSGGGGGGGGGNSGTTTGTYTITVTGSANGASGTAGTITLTVL
jgi:hypothetical protein